MIRYIPRTPTVPFFRNPHGSTREDGRDVEVRLVCRLQPKVHWVPEIYYKFGAPANFSEALTQRVAIRWIQACGSRKMPVHQKVYRSLPSHELSAPGLIAWQLFILAKLNGCTLL